jgi:uncharacterized protein (TIGR02118 family)
VPAASPVSYFVRYAGLSQPADRFVSHYRDVHAPILGEFPGIRGLTLFQPAEWHDPQGVNPGGADFMAQMDFDDLAAFQAALESDARARARTDFANLPVGDARVTHQAMTRERLF